MGKNKIVLLFIFFLWIVFLLPQKVLAADPGGWLDAADCSSFRGWTCDADNYNQSIDVHFYANGPAGGGGSFAGAMTANETSDAGVKAACGNSNVGHRFTFITPDSLKDGQNHSIYAYGINIPSGNNPQLSGSPKTINCVGRNAQYISQSCPPSTMTPNQTASVSVTMKNNGNFTWTSAASYRLGTQNPPDVPNWGIGRVNLTSSVAPGSSYPFNFTATAPSSQGTYNFQWKMVQDGVAWFGDTTPNCSINVASPPPPTPIISSPNPSCTSTNTNSMYTISWASSTPAVTWIDVSSNNFASFYNKNVSGTLSTDASSGLNLYGGSGSLTFQPSTTYQVRLWNGSLHSNVATFTTPNGCPPALPTTLPPSCSLPGTSATISWNAVPYTTRYQLRVDDQANGWGTCISPNPGDICEDTTATSRTFTGTPGNSYAWWLEACNNYGCSSSAGGTTFTCTAPAPTVAPAPGNAVCSGTTNPIRSSAGLLSSFSLNHATTINKFSTSEYCLINEKASIPPFSVPNYNDMKAVYFDKMDKAKTPASSYTTEKITGNATQGNIQSKLDNLKDTIINVTGDVDINGPFNQPNKSRVIVIFINGKFTISNNIDYSKDIASRGLVFVVSGNVNINPSVTEVNAFIITYGQFCSAPQDDGSCVTTVAPALNIKGSVISLGTVSPKFVRTLADNATPAEVITYQPKYMVILKDIFSRTLSIWKEFQ
ncbi:MAG: NBR1-Ig-like domain-containing protein [Candidatus Daviesbacteria bacterium]|nr:NBR1-Ig-like domain-containing protein [Candidatus Daviesbacteria bacterium]